MGKDWTGNRKSTYVTIGASSHSEHARQREDYYATSPEATEWLLRLEKFSGPILEPACGEGHISKVLSRGYDVTSRDLIDRGFGEVADFLSIDNLHWDGDIVTNPPYKYAQEFVEKALQIIPDGHKVCMFLKLTFLSSKARRYLFDTQPPCRVWVSSSRLKCGFNGHFEGPSSAVDYAWYVWVKGYKGDTVIKWFN